VVVLAAAAAAAAAATASSPSIHLQTLDMLIEVELT